MFFCIYVYKSKHFHPPHNIKCREELHMLLLHAFILCLAEYILYLLLWFLALLMKSCFTVFVVCSLCKYNTLECVSPTPFAAHRHIKPYVSNNKEMVFNYTEEMPAAIALYSMYMYIPMEAVWSPRGSITRPDSSLGLRSLASSTVIDTVYRVLEGH